jgi:hypothetical protein
MFQIITIYAPVIYTAPSIMFWMGAYTLRGEVGGGWALEFPRFLGPVKWERADRRVPFWAQGENDKRQKHFYFRKVSGLLKSLGYSKKATGTWQTFGLENYFAYCSTSHLHVFYVQSRRTVSVYTVKNTRYDAGRIKLLAGK